ncbi:MAG: aminoglycoside 6'-N-acetyltransferase [Bacillota bacterium]
MPNVVKVDKSNLNEWARLSFGMYGEHHTFAEMLASCQEFLINNKETGYLYEIDGNYVGFINTSIRNDYVNGTDGSPVVYVEAVYVLDEYRGRGIAKSLIKVAEEFARANGCKQLASDCMTSNTASEKFHKDCGFEEVERVICFVKNVC